MPEEVLNDLLMHENPDVGEKAGEILEMFFMEFDPEFYLQERPDDDPEIAKLFSDNDLIYGAAIAATPEPSVF